MKGISKSLIFQGVVMYQPVNLINVTNFWKSNLNCIAGDSFFYLLFCERPPCTLHYMSRAIWSIILIEFIKYDARSQVWFYIASMPTTIYICKSASFFSFERWLRVVKTTRLKVTFVITDKKILQRRSHCHYLKCAEEKKIKAGFRKRVGGLEGLAPI